jgi:fatty acid desaturase
MRCRVPAWFGVWGALGALAIHVAIAAAAGWAGLITFQAASSRAFEGAWGWSLFFFVCYVFMVFVLGSRMRALGNMLHEASHRTLSSSVRLNDALGYLLAALDLQAFQRYRREHLSHHLYLGSVERDLDFQRTRDFGFAKRMASPWRVHMLGALGLKHLSAFLRPVLWSREDPPVVTALRFVAYGSIGVALHVAGAWQEFLLVFLVPYATTYQMFRYWSDAFDHGSLLGEEDEFLRTRNHCFDFGKGPRKWLQSRVFEALVFPRNDVFHLTHHLFPSVSTRHLREVHEFLMKDACYAARNHRVTVEMFDVLKTDTSTK